MVFDDLLGLFLISMFVELCTQRLRVLLKKELKYSDIGSLGRIVLPKVSSVKSFYYIFFFSFCCSLRRDEGKRNNKGTDQNLSSFILLLLILQHDCDLHSTITISFHDQLLDFCTHKIISKKEIDRT